MTDSRFDIDSFKNVQSGTAQTESLSELLEQESRRYNRRLGEEDEAKTG